MNKTGYIYSLTCSNPNLIYYGSTTKTLNDRLSQHKYDFKNNKCVSSKKLFEWGNIKINMLEEIEFKEKNELLEREAYYIKNLKCVNKRIPNRTNKEWITDNKDKIKQKNKKYRLENKDKLKQYYYDNKDKLKEKRKKYILENKDKIKEYNDKRYNDNKDKIKERRKEKITCDCGANTTKHHYARHCKSKKHLQYKESNINLVV